MEFNAKLPVSVEVIDRGFLDKYTLRLGTQTIECKSVKELEVGKRYWAELRRSSVGSILISNLIKKPEVLSYIDYFFTFDSLEHIFELLTDAKRYKKMVLDALANSRSKKEFLFYTNLLLSIQSRVTTVPMKMGSKFFFLQFKAEENFVKIYLIFSNLAPLEIKLHIDTESLEVYSPYESVLSLILDDGEFIMNSSNLKKDIKPIFDFKSSLLDLKG